MEQRYGVDQVEVFQVIATRTQGAIGEGEMLGVRVDDK